MLPLSFGNTVFPFTRPNFKTPSKWQVRQPIYSSSVKRWKRYEKFLDPLKEGLGVYYRDGE